MHKHLESAEPVFYMIEHFMHGKTVSQIDFRMQVNASFNLFKIKAIDQQLSEGAIEEAQYALVALVDEMVLNSDVVWKQEWSQSSLQQQYFHTHNSGEGFFDRLYELRKTALLNQFVLEIYYVCLLLGFKGKYIGLNNEKRLALIVEFKAQLSAIQVPIVDNCIADKLIVKKIGHKCNRRKWSKISNTSMIVCALMIVVIMILFIRWSLDF